MAVYEIKQDNLVEVAKTTFAQSGIGERSDLQRLLRERIDIISPDTMVIAEEFGEWEDSKRRIDLLGLDSDANLVVFELKRTETGGHMELQAIRYAAMISPMTFKQVVAAHQRYLTSIGKEEAGAEQDILDFLGWTEPNQWPFANRVRIVLASAEFSKEITSAVIWLNAQGLDIRCVRLCPYKLDDRLLLDVQQIIPLPEAAEYQVMIREKNEQERVVRESSVDLTRYDLRIGNAVFPGLWKRQLIFRVVKEAIARGATPDQVSEAIPWKRVFFCVEGTYSGAEFLPKAAESLAKAGRSFDSRRFFTSEDELIRFEGKTYAFTNQWGGPSTFKAVEKVIELMQASDISLVPSV